MKDYTLKANVKDDKLALLKAELAVDENLVWHGSPQPNIRSHLFMFLIGFAVFWNIFIFFGMYDFLSDSRAPIEGQIIIIAFFIPFILAGIFLIKLPFKIYMGMSKTIYAITNKRAIIMRPKHTESYTADAMGEITIRNLNSGRGNVYFRKPVSDNDVVEIILSGDFENVENPRLVQRHLEELKSPVVAIID